MSNLIDRQVAINAVEESRRLNHHQDGKEACAHEYEHRHFLKILNDLPDAQRWIPCSERMPEDLDEVNVTWVNHDPEPYYNFVKDKPFTATAVYYKEKWYWYSSTCTDLLAEYGRNPNEEIDDGIEIIAWMPLPKPWKGGKDE